MSNVNVTLKEAAKILAEKDNILILCHIRPDGDTLGSGYGLKYALEALGKRAKVLCDDNIPGRLAFIGDQEQQLENERKTLEANARVEAYRKTRYELGADEIKDWLDALRALNSTRLAVLEARFGVISATNAIYQAMGGQISAR
jgi:hypothetical protein